MAYLIVSAILLGATVDYETSSRLIAAPRAINSVICATIRLDVTAKTLKAELVLRKFGIRKDPITPEDGSDTPRSTPDDAPNDANTCKNSDVEPTP